MTWYDDDTPPHLVPLVTIEWVDIQATSDSPALKRRWTDGRLLSVDYMSEGVACVVTGRTWDEDGWTDFDTFPANCVTNLADLCDVLSGTEQDEQEDSDD